MTYARLLLLFLVIPTVVLNVLVLRDCYRVEQNRVAVQRGFLTLLMLIVVAVFYAAPWDNHLIATGVWWYRLTLVSSITFERIPLEELLFFVLQTLLIGLWLLWLLPHLTSRGPAHNSFATLCHAGDKIRSPSCDGKARFVSVVVGGCLWLLALAVLRLGWKPGTYLAWELMWGLPPMILQLGLAGDILWRYRRLLGVVLISGIIYLCGIDGFAIHEGIWTIDSHQTLGILFGAQLPLEEVIFFSLTSALIAFGLILGVTVETRERLHGYRALFGTSLERS